MKNAFNHRNSISIFKAKINFFKLVAKNKILN